MSFKDKLVGSIPNTQVAREEENFELLDGDVIIEIVDGVP